VTGHATVLAVELITAKLTGQAAIAARLLNDPHAAQTIQAGIAKLEAIGTVNEALRIEAAAARNYFRAWRTLRLRFARADEGKVPENWHVFDQRTSVLATGHSPRYASSPINAILNYCYALAAAEARFACRAVGLDPTLGVLHRDNKDGRESLALDLLEPIRPDVDAYVLDLARDHTFTRRELTETRDGRCRLRPPLTHALAEASPAWAKAIASHAERVAHILGSAADGKVRRRAPLTGRALPTSSTATDRSRRLLPAPNCPDCGQPLADKRRLRCPDCHQIERRRLAHERAEITARRLAQLQTQVPRPASNVLRSATAAAQAAANAAWDADHPNEDVDRQQYRQEVLAAIQSIPIAMISSAVGVGHDAAWRIREGTLTPHRRHWDALAELGNQESTTGRTS
jgi:hypothetical protein